MNQALGKSYFQQRQRNRLYEIVIKAVEAAGERGVKKRDIAARIGTSPSQISHFLSGPANWTIDSVSDILYAIDIELDFSAAGLRDKVKDNRYHPLNDAPPGPPPVSAKQEPLK